MLGNDAPEASVPGEIIPSREFYDYEAKYLDNDSRTDHSGGAAGDRSRRKCSGWPSRSFAPSTAPGMARVDFLMDGATGTLYVNEINTIPGFTTISMYSKMWAASGLPYPALLDRLIALAQERHAEKQQLNTSTECVAVRSIAVPRSLCLLARRLVLSPCGTQRASPNPEPLAKAYELILDARFDEAEQQLSRPAARAAARVRSCSAPSPTIGGC